MVVGGMGVRGKGSKGGGNTYYRKERGEGGYGRDDERRGGRENMEGQEDWD